MMTEHSQLSIRNCTALVFGLSVLTTGLPASASNWRDSCSLSQTQHIGNIVPNEEGVAVLNLSLELDGDGAEDRIQIKRNHKAYGRGQTRVSVTLSKLADPIEFEYYYEYRNIDIIPVPAVLQGDEAAPARLAIMDALVGARCEAPDPSLEWFLSDRTIAWRQGLPQSTFDYVLRLPSVPAGLVSAALGHPGFDVQSLDRPVWLIYRGDRQGDLAETDNSEADSENDRFLRDFALLVTSPEYKVWESGQGLVVSSVSREAYAWIYVNDSMWGWADMRKRAFIEADTITVRVSIPFDEPVTQIIRADVGLGTVSEIVNDITAPPPIEFSRRNCQDYFDKGRYKDALGACRRVIVHEPRDADARYRMGTIYEAIGSSRLAIWAYRKTISVDASHLEAAARIEALESAPDGK